LAVRRGRANARKVLAQFAAKTDNEVYVMDMFTDRIVLRLNAKHKKRGQSFPRVMKKGSRHR